MQLKVKNHITFQICLYKRLNIKNNGVRIAQFDGKNKVRIFFLTGLQYLFKPHILIGLSINIFLFH